jgi:regulatory protein
MPVVTALRPVGARIAVELDGAPWRTLPIDAVATVGLAPGTELDRVRARALAQALRRGRAEEVALRALARRDHSRATLDARLARAGVAERERRDVIERAEQSRLVDDSRFAQMRAAHLAARGAGDALILDDLSRSGIDEAVASTAVDSLAPESERAAGIISARGASSRTIRYLATRGFSEETIEELIADIES